MGRKTYRAFHPEQSELFPGSPREWLPEGHLAYFVLDVVKALDLSAIHAHYERSLRGYPPHHPQMLVGVLLYGYATGVTSSRRLERKLVEDVAFRVLAGGARPDHSTISEFRRVHLSALSTLFVQMLRLCQKAGLVKLGHVALDGTKVKASASKHKAMSYERMQLKEAELSAKVKALMAEAEGFDRAEDSKYGEGRRGDELPADLAHAQSRLARIREAKAALEAEALALHEAEKKAAETAAKADRDDNDRDDNSDDDSSNTGAALPTHRVPRYVDGKPKPKAQRNFTDAESRIQKTNDGFVQGYNCQAVVDDANQIIVAQAVTNQPPDVEHFVPMLEMVKLNCGVLPDKLTADAGYFSEANAKKARTLNVNAHIAIGRQKHGTELVTAEQLASATDDTERQRMAHKLATEDGRKTYALRKAVVEPVFGQIKHARGFRQFLLRGIHNVRGEWALAATAHNLLKLFSSTTLSARPAL
jgi:transposase